jgi:hypothetical protein
MSDSIIDPNAEVNLSQPVIANGEIQFAAFGPGWGFRAFAVTADVAVQRLGAKDRSASQLLLAFQLNRLRIVGAVAECRFDDPGKRALLSTI